MGSNPGLDLCLQQPLSFKSLSCVSDPFRAFQSVSEWLTVPQIVWEILRASQSILEATQSILDPFRVSQSFSEVSQRVSEHLIASWKWQKIIATLSEAKPKSFEPNQIDSQGFTWDTQLYYVGKTGIFCKVDPLQPYNNWARFFKLTWALLENYKK